MSQKGLVPDVTEGRRDPVIIGNMMVSSENNHELGRSANVARILVGLPLEPEPLPRLLDATLSGTSVTGFVLNGVE